MTAHASQHKDFDHQTSTWQDLTFAYARPAFEKAGVPWNDETLSELHLRLEDGQYSNVALLLADQCPFHVKCTTFAGDFRTTVAARDDLSGSLLKQIDDAMACLEHHDSDHAWPKEALHESLINALLHRNYMLSGPTLISMFDSRIEIVSLGGLTGGLEVNDLLNGVSQSRNPWLADLFARLNLSENCGTGVQRVLESYAHSMASPQLRVGPTSLAMVLPKPVLDSEAWPSPTVRSSSSSAELDQTGTGDGAEPGHAKRYRFPTAKPYTTDDPAAALAGMRVIGVAPLSTLVLASQHGDAASEKQQGEHGAHPQPAGSEFGLEVEKLSQHNLEEVTLHLFAQRGVQLTRAEVERKLGSPSGPIAQALHALTQQGKLEKVHEEQEAVYRLSRA